jgi:hypothetical protein
MIQDFVRFVGIKDYPFCNEMHENQWMGVLSIGCHWCECVVNIFVYIESFHLRYDVNIDHIFLFLEFLV